MYVFKQFRLLFLTALISAGLSFHAHSQDVISFPDDLDGWDYSWDTGISGSQASYSNWAQGGVNNIAVTGNSEFTAFFHENRYSYGFLINTRYGKTRIQDEGTRKIDDRLSIKNRLLYDLSEDDSDFKLFTNINFRTQFDKGFNYGAGPEGGNILISDFMAPAYFNQNAGLAYIPTENFIFEAGLGLQQTFVRNRELSETYGLQEGERWRSEAGLTISTSYSIRVGTNLRLKSSVDTFTALDKSISSTDIYFSNRLVGRINNFMNTTLSLDLVYDDDFSNQIQVAQVLSLGVSFTLL